MKFVKLKELNQFKWIDNKDYHWQKWDASTNKMQKSPEKFPEATKQMEVTIEPDDILTLTEGQVGKILSKFFNETGKVIMTGQLVQVGILYVPGGGLPTSIIQMEERIHIGKGMKYEPLNTRYFFNIGRDEFDQGDIEVAPQITPEQRTKVAQPMPPVTPDETFPTEDNVPF